MGKEKPQKARLIEERARALAIMCLTRRSDLIVREESKEIGLDLLVSIHRDEKEGLRQFGVELQGSFSSTTVRGANASLRASVQRMLKFGPFPFPVLLFLFTMEDNQGWYTWVTEPVISSKQDVALGQYNQADCEVLDDRAVDYIVKRVDDWYDAFFAKTNKAHLRRRQRVS